jgi:hypothetical protein
MFLHWCGFRQQKNILILAVVSAICINALTHYLGKAKGTIETNQGARDLYTKVQLTQVV